MDLDSSVLIYFCVGAVVVITLYIIGMCLGKKYCACCKDDEIEVNHLGIDIFGPITPTYFVSAMIPEV
ncbi:hypothetical protein PRIPAC_85792 [Pristionchus pacificus]|uniref:Uncharacterized protein n=1 Tax=Pristionchus pacificus TaxID=54126 RepID=A0A2A6BM91_PRIPA|nr:hypothetical protein PRIPAC_85792 [Pristionchus pacificus]|eukprot:PDM67044.1 hypothetical protein PRIPAC_48461 [Pristionchus pacificus]